MKASKADIIVGMAKAIQDIQDERDMLQLCDFEFMTDYWKVEDHLIARMDDLYQEIVKVIQNDEIEKYFR